MYRVLVGADQQGATGAGQRAQALEEIGAGGGFKIANGGAGKNTTRPDSARAWGMAMAWQ